MANRQTTLLLKRSNVIGKIPPISGLTLGEMALNTADAKLYSLYTSGTTGATEVRQIGWDRISRTGDTVTGDFNFFGNISISGSVLPNGYALTVTGDTDIVGDLYVEGDIDYDGNLIVSGSGVFQSGLTANTIYTDYIDFNTGATVPQSVGRVSWDTGTGTLNIAVGDAGTGLIDLQVGQEEIVRVYNSEATTLQKGEIVYVSGSNGNRPAVKRALATSDGYSVTTLGMVDRNIASGAEGYVTTFGVISNLNTSGLTGGTAIWLSGTVPGGYTSDKPIAPLHTVLIGYVVRVSATVGSIFVNISNGWELDELHDVRISAATEGDLLMRSSFSGSPVWVNTKILNGSYTITGNTNIGGNLTVSDTTYLQGLSATTISATTIGVSGDCIDDIYVSNIHSCSPLNINPLDEGNVYFGSTSGVTIDLSNDRVGIGTSTPSTLLHVVGSYTGGTDALIPQMLFQNSNTIPNTNKTAIIRTSVGSGYVAGGYPEIWLESQETSTGVGLTKLRTVSNHPLLFYTNDIERGRFGHTGNFGLNTQSPAGMLHVRTGVNKNIIFTSGATRNIVRSLIDGNSDYVGLEIDTLDLNIKTNGVNRMIINSSGDTGIGTITPTAKLHINNTTSGNTFLAEDDTNPDSSPFVIDASGNTGIGIVTPTVKLHLSGNSIFEQSKLTINQKDGIVGIDIVNSGESMYQLSNSITDWCIVGKTPSEFYFYNSLNVPIRFYTNASEKMTVLGNGNVGIGITSPTAKFHINNTTSGNTFLAEDDTNPDSTPFVIDTSGNTGIGTLFPTAKLDVRGDTIISSGLTATTINVPPLADDKIVYTTNNGRLTTTSAFTYNQSNNTFSVNNIDANGNFNITGNTTQSGNTFQNGNLNITGNTNQIGNFTITGNTTQSGDTTQIGNFTITGNTVQSGNTTQYGNIDLTGNTTQIGSVTLSGNTFITGNTDQVGNVNITGNTVIDGSLSADTITITNTPTLNNTLFQILGRNETTGDVEYRQVNTIGNNVTILTGGTYSAQTTIDNVIGVDTTLTTTTIYLPDSVSSGRLRFEIKDIGLNAYNNPITIIAAGTDTIISYTNSQTLIMESEGGAIILLNTGLGQWWQM